MTNFQIIIREVIASGLYSKEEIEAYLSTEGELPLHTFQEWKRKGYSIKKGEKAVMQCDIWKPYIKKEDQEKADETKLSEADSYYMTKASFFNDKQVEKI